MKLSRILAGAAAPVAFLLVLSAAHAEGPFNRIKVVDANFKVYNTTESGVKYLNLVGNKYGVRIEYGSSDPSPTVQFSENAGESWALITTAAGYKIGIGPQCIDASTLDCSTDCSGCPIFCTCIGPTEDVCYLGSQGLGSASELRLLSGGGCD